MVNTIRLNFAPVLGEDYFDTSSIAGSLPVTSGLDAIAIGKSASASATQSVQIGSGINNTANTLQFLTQKVADDNGLYTSFNAPINYTGNNSVTNHLQGIDSKLGALSSTFQAIHFASNSTGSLPNATGVDAIAIGKSANASADRSVQIGLGTNSSTDTLQFLTQRIADSNGLYTSFSAPVNYVGGSNSVANHLQAIDVKLGLLSGSPVQVFTAVRTNPFIIVDSDYDKFIRINTNSTPVTVTLTTSVRSGFKVILMRTGTNSVTIDPATLTFVGRGVTIGNNNAAVTLTYDQATTTWYGIGDLV